MITESTVYWILKLNYIMGWAIAFAIILMTFSIIYLIIATKAYDDAYLENKHKIKKHFVISILCIMASFILLMGALLIPSTKEMCLSKVLPKVANNEDIQEIPNKLIDLTDEWIEELRPNKTVRINVEDLEPKPLQ